MVPSDPLTSTRALRAVAEIAFGYALILITIWSPMPTRNYYALAAAFWIGGAILLSRLGGERRFVLRDVFRDLGRCSWAMLISFAAAACFVALSAHLGTLHFDSGLTTQRPPLLGYLIWSLLQQVVLQLFLMTRLLLLLRRPGWQSPWLRFWFPRHTCLIRC